MFVGFIFGSLLMWTARIVHILKAFYLATDKANNSKHGGTIEEGIIEEKPSGASNCEPLATNTKISSFDFCSKLCYDPQFS